MQQLPLQVLEQSVFERSGRRINRYGLESDIMSPTNWLPSSTLQAEEASGAVAKLQSALADDNSGQAASDSLSEEIARLKANVAAEKVRFSHITEALEATKGSAEEVQHMSNTLWLPCSGHREVTRFALRCQVQTIVVAVVNQSERRISFCCR